MNFPRPVHPMLAGNSRSSYEGFWDASRRLAAQNAPLASTHQAAKAIQQAAEPTESGPKRTDVLNALAKKTTKEVRNWFREQIEGLDESSSD